MVKHSVRDVWSGGLQESNHGGRGGFSSEKRTGQTFFGSKFIACNFLVTI